MLAIDQFIENLPKTETHLHLEGAVPWEWVLAHTTENLPLHPEWLDDNYRFADFTDFGAVFYHTFRHVITTPQGYADVAQHYFQRLIAENVRYVEISIGVDGALMRGLPVTEIVDSVHSIIPPELQVRIIGGINRRAEGEIYEKASQTILETPYIDGIDLHGDERVNHPEAFTDLFQAAHEKGYILRAHAGELTSADTIERTIDALGVTRIEHGISAWEDEKLIERLITEHITLDMCPTSNVKLQVVGDWNAHPLAKFLRRGVRVTCSTDDPAIFATSPNNELRQLVKYHELTVQELAMLQINAFEAARLDETTRQTLIAEVNALVEQVQ